MSNRLVLEHNDYWQKPLSNLESVISKYNKELDKVFTAKLYRLSNQLLEKEEYIISGIVYSIAENPTKDNMEKLESQGYSLDITMPEFRTDWDMDNFTASMKINLNNVKIKLVKTVVEI